MRLEESRTRGRPEEVANDIGVAAGPAEVGALDELVRGLCGRGLRNAIAAERRRMPWMAVEKEYRFEGPDGPASLLDLVEGRRQLILYRFFFEPGVAGWPEKGCRGCSMRAVREAHPAHLNDRDTTLACVSRAPPAGHRALEGADGLADSLVHDHGRLRRRRVARHQRLLRDHGDRIFRTYFVNGRGDEALGSTFSFLDITALGRQEEWEDSPEGYPRTQTHPEWWRLPDAYGTSA